MREPLKQSVPVVSQLPILLVLTIGTSTVITLTAQQPSFRSGIDLVSLSVTVTDSRGRYIADLDADDFTVLEDSRPQRLVFFAPATSALAVSLLLDSSASMEKQLPLVQKAASEFVARLRAGDRAQIINFDSRVHVLQSFTADRDALERAIWSVRTGGTTSLYNAVYIALRQLETFRTPAEIRREVVVVLSDGEDTSSLVGYDELLEVAKRSRAVIYAISLGSSPSRMSLSPATREFELRRFTQETGGRLLLARGATNLSNLYDEIAEELTSQYVMGYLSSNAGRGGWRSISVRISRPNVQVRTRTGYFAPEVRAVGQ